MHVLSTLVVDDEPLARKGLIVRLSKHKEINMVSDCSNGRQALELVKLHKPDLLFIDIKMPGLNGFDVVNEIICLNLPMPLIVFVTAFEEYALRAFQVHAQDYLLKPADELSISNCIEKIKERVADKESTKQKLKLAKLVSDVTGNTSDDILHAIESDQPVALNQYSNILAIKDGLNLNRVPIVDILWIDAAGDYMCVHTLAETFILRKTMKQLEQTLDPNIFIRSHRSTIVNKNYISKFCSQLNGEYYIVMTNAKELKVSRSYKYKVKNILSV